MLLESLLPNLPASTPELVIYIAAALGAVLITYAVFVEAEHRRDLIRIIGCGFLFVYALFIENLIFMIAMGGVFLASLIEFVEIYMGLHKHSREHLEEYKKYAFLGKKRK